MKILNKVHRVYREWRTTSAYTGRFVFFVRHVGALKTILLFILVRKYNVPLSTYATMVHNLEVVPAVGLGQYLYQGMHSYEEIKIAVRAGDDEFSRKEREKFEDNVIGNS